MNDHNALLFEKAGWLCLPDFMDAETTLEISNQLDRLSSEGLMKKAGIGRGSAFQLAESRRGDFIQWVDRDTADVATCRFFDRLDEVIIWLNRSFYLGIRDRECHFTSYPPGSRYERHTDRHLDGSSRVVSFVFYLNVNWQPADAGELVIYQNDGQSIRIEPKAGTLALFLSEMEHEVMTTNLGRKSITGWLLNESRK